MLLPFRPKCLVQLSDGGQHVKQCLRARDNFLEAGEDGQKDNFDRYELANRYASVDHEPSARNQQKGRERESQSDHDSVHSVQNLKVVAAIL